MQNVYPDSEQNQFSLSVLSGNIESENKNSLIFKEDLMIQTEL